MGIIYIYSLQQASIRIPINLPVLWNVASFFSCSLLTCIGRHTFKEGDRREQHFAVFWFTLLSRFYPCVSTWCRVFLSYKTLCQSHEFPRVEVGSPWGSRRKVCWTCLMAKAFMPNMSLLACLAMILKMNMNDGWYMWLSDIFLGTMTLRARGERRHLFWTFADQKPWAN